MSTRFELVDGTRKPRKKWAKANAQGEWRIVRVTTCRDGSPYVQPSVMECANQAEITFDDLIEAKCQLLPSLVPSIPMNYTPWGTHSAKFPVFVGRGSGKADAILTSLLDSLPITKTFIEFDDPADALLFKLTWGGK